ncbi:MAG: hypothetical protein F4123_01025 [Gemmatimonadetes bacterium]|nr:hypothetical protein [Gemmatimonadota bacterium]MYB98206.1 hypothetical protein [Gemmatimonadota bacterium]MYI44973.1 hypothetical protein [Gemmatimonadota bacterium]
METLTLSKDIPRTPVGQILTHDERSIALVDLGQDASKALRASWPKDQPFESGGVVDSTWLLPMLGAGSTAASSLMAGNVFLATANPATLMTIGSGVGSAVMGPGGIVAQAPFIAASSALMPVVAPVMLFTTVSSVMMCARLDRAQRTLGRLYEVVERARRLLDAEDYARFEAAAERIDEIRSEFEHSRRFASDVLDKLARIDYDVGVLRSKYGLMTAEAVDSEEAAKVAVSDLNRFFLASLYDVQIDMLQLYLAIQNDADVVEFRQSRLEEKIGRYGDDFRKVLEDDRVGAYHRELKADLSKSGWWLTRRLGLGEAEARLRMVRAIRGDLNACQARIHRWVEASEAVTEESRRQAVVVHLESNGQRRLRAYHTAEVRVEAAA